MAQLGRGPRDARLVVVLVALLLLPALVSSGGLRPAKRCHLSAELVPSCGALLGVTPPTPTVAGLRQAEDHAGRRFDLVYTFHDINDRVPSAFDSAVVGSGAVLHLSVDARDYADPDRASVTWASVARGEHDAELREQARGIAGLHERVFVTFDHEADQPSHAALGSPADFVRAWRHVHRLFDANGADNVVWVWVMLGWAPSFPVAARMWPGNRYVDWISWDAYNDAGCRTGPVTTSRQRSFADVALPFLRWVHRTGPQIGMDIRKPLMISETGTLAYVEGSAAELAWYRGMSQVLRSHPQIRAVTLWDHAGSSPVCDFRLSASRGSEAAVRRLADDPWFNGRASVHH